VQRPQTSNSTVTTVSKGTIKVAYETTEHQLRKNLSFLKAGGRGETKSITGQSIARQVEGLDL
jgi:hypothetical protein